MGNPQGRTCRMWRVLMSTPQAYQHRTDLVADFPAIMAEACRRMSEDHTRMDIPVPSVLKGWKVVEKVWPCRHYRVHPAGDHRTVFCLCLPNGAHLEVWPTAKSVVMRWTHGQEDIREQGGNIRRFPFKGYNTATMANRVVNHARKCARTDANRGLWGVN